MDLARSAEIQQDEICSAGKEFNSQTCEAPLQFGAAAAEFAQRAPHVGAITHGGTSRYECGDIYGVRRLGFAETGGKFAAREDATETQPGEAGGLGKCSSDHEICVPSNPRKDRDARIFEIGFVDDD